MNMTLSAALPLTVIPMAQPNPQIPAAAPVAQVDPPQAMPPTDHSPTVAALWQAAAGPISPPQPDAARTYTGTAQTLAQMPDLMDRVGLLPEPGDLALLPTQPLLHRA